MGFGKKAFTFMELMVVVTIVGIVAGFAIPNYTRSVERAYRKDGENNLLMIGAAQRIYAARNNGQYLAAPDVNAINSGLGLAIIPNEMTYLCTSVSCSAVRHVNYWFLLYSYPTNGTIVCNPMWKSCP